MPSRLPKPALRGRQFECATLDQLLTDVRASRSRALVVRGEAGVGKTALLEYLATRASTCRIVRATGFESEMELPYAGVHQLCAPLLDHLPRLPAPQRAALETAFGLSSGNPPDRFLVGLAVFGLLSDVSEGHPLICLFDDAQWLDRTSAQLLAFVARRLLADAVAMVFALREPCDDSAFDGLRTLTIGGLNDADARALLASAVLGRLDTSVADRIIAESLGNPLALLELSAGHLPAELAGGFAQPDARPLASRIEESFVQRILALSSETQRLLLAAAADPVGDVALLWRAAERLGIDEGAVAPAMAAGLIELGARVRFSHPLVRSASYRAATARDRQEVHSALAAATDPESDPDRQAWHRALAAEGPDEEVAQALEHSADRARRRGGVAASGAFLERATVLTPDMARRGARALAAARAKFEAAAPESASQLLAVAERSPLNELQRALVTRLRAEIVFARRRGNDAPPLLRDAARRLEGLDDELARETYLEAFASVIYAGRLGRHEIALEVAAAARALAHGSLRPVDLLIEGMATRFIDGCAAGVPLLQQALRAIADEHGGSETDLRWLWLTSPIAFEAWDDGVWDRLTARAVKVARASGALAELRVALAYRAGVEIHAGDFASGATQLEEADAISLATGLTPMGKYAWQALAAWRGDEAQVLRLTEADLDDATARGEGRVIGIIGFVTALLYNGQGKYQKALAGARLACEYDDLGIFGWSLAELVEAGARSGARELAHDAERRLEASAVAAGTDWGLGMLARSRALLSDGDEADELFREAIDRLGRSRIVVQCARAHLTYGEWLRRENRRVDARHHLRIAHEQLSRMGAEAFAERARRELLATGETVRKRTTATTDVLTAQESQIARLAVDGRTNPEIGSELFISSRTVEYHLAKVFAKLGVSSRRELRDTLHRADRASAPA